MTWSWTDHEIVDSWLGFVKSTQNIEGLLSLGSLRSFLTVCFAWVLLFIHRVKTKHVVLLVMADGVDVLHVRLLWFLGVTHLSSTCHDSSSKRWFLVCHWPSLLFRDLSYFLSHLLLLLLHHHLLLLLSHLLLSQDHHLVLLLVIQLGILSIHVEIVLDKVAILISLVDVFKLVMWIEYLLLVVLISIFFIKGCSIRGLVVYNLLLHFNLVIIFELWFIFIVITSHEFLVVMLTLDNNFSIIDIVFHLIIVFFSILIFLFNFLLFTLITVFIFLLILQVLNQLLVVL